MRNRSSGRANGQIDSRSSEDIWSSPDLAGVLFQEAMETKAAIMVRTFWLLINALSIIVLVF